MKLKAIVHQAEEGGYWAEVPALPGCITEGDTMEELESNLKDAIEGWLEVANDNHTVENSCSKSRYLSVIKSIFVTKS
jgi:predicted RNase H-like HicB family nuclease